ncbi:hypothetical protein Francci3_0227 [Frankia casuarinae]|uniref:Uncharacterized protein n=1 Tax=Frankia casuarinae (strain DSM 45818 / CECT 9043 / HFP020203 / CcI3) TaxID=106370 RepID=Q2JGH6_FRACC|nr:hypothetical protein Francci3_0227 [Frankia casuarinae]
MSKGSAEASSPRSPPSGPVCRPRSPASCNALFPCHWEVIAVATATTNLLNTPIEDQRVERVRRAALSAYVDGKISFAQANLRVRKALQRFGV